MNPYKVITSYPSFFCDSSKEYFEKHPKGLQNNLSSWKKMIELMENDEEISKDVNALTKEEKWIKRAYRAMNIDMFVKAGGDLKETNQYRVIRGTVLCEGSYKKCTNYINGHNFKYVKDGVQVDRATANWDWDLVVDNEGKAEKTVEELMHGCRLERRYYDEVDSIELWEKI
jgi:hypothetical protein